MQAELPPLAGFHASLRSKTSGSINGTVDITPTSTREPSVGSKCGEDSSSDSIESPVTNHPQYLIESDEDDDFFESDHYKMPSTREPSPEPFSDTAKRYGWSLETPLPKQEMFPIPQFYQIPPVHSSMRLPSATMPSNQTDRGLSLDYLARYSSPGVQPTAHVELESCKEKHPISNLLGASESTVSRQSFEEMQRESRKLNRNTTWLRVVHRGYGQVAWRTALQELKLTSIIGPFASEGDYVRIPEGVSAESIVNTLTDCNLTVRKLVWFKGMKRANKSRVLFKWEPFTVSPYGVAKPILVETKAFSQDDCYSQYTSF